MSRLDHCNFADGDLSRAWRHCVSVLLGLTALVAQEEPPPAPLDGLVHALQNGRFGGRLRYRLDYVDSDAKPDSALASTWRTELHYTSKPWHGWTGFVEVYANESVGEDAYFGITNGKSGAQYPLVSDPEGAGLNRGWLRFAPDDCSGLQVKLGRQFIHWNDGRMLGNSFYRQNQNTFDALSCSVQPCSELEWNYAYVWRHDDVFARAFDMDSHVAQLAFTVPDQARAAAYVTRIDYRDRDEFDRDTCGVRITGPWRVDEDLAVHYTAEYARQFNRGENPFSVDADYAVVELGASHCGYLLYVGYNRVGGTGDPAGARPFDQPAGYPYPYRGETEQMVVTPMAGLEILMLRAVGPVPGIDALSFHAHAHRFWQEVGGLDYGSDVGLSLAYAPRDSGWGMFVKAARFVAGDAGAGFDDTTRLILGVELTF